MRLRFLCTVLLWSLFFSCDNDDYPHSEIPSLVLNSFHAQFPDAMKIDFDKRREHYEIEFKLNQNKFGALVDSTGNILKTKREASWKELPVEVRSWLEKEYGKKKIEDPEVIKARDQVYYQVQINLFPIDKKVVINRNGTPNSSKDYWD